MRHDRPPTLHCVGLAAYLDNYNHIRYKSYMENEPSFAPATQRVRCDGWIPDRQRLFIEALSEWGSVRQAAEHVGMTASTAYRLRIHPEAREFAGHGTPRSTPPGSG